MGKKILLETRNLSYKYEDGTQALSNVDFRVEEGQRIAVLGANGSGKSTLFLCLMGILKPESGLVLFAGQPVDYSRKGLHMLRKNVGIVFQEPDNQLFSASVYQEISFGPMNLGWDLDTVRHAVEGAIDQLEITPFQDKPTHFLSGGQKKQVSIADIIAMKPKVIMMDEPTSALDPKHSAMVNRMVDQLCDTGITVLISTHDGDYALEWADQAVVFHEGKVECAGLPQDIFQDAALLERTHQMQPKVLQIYHTLLANGILRESKVIPKSIPQLQSYIAQM